MVCLCLCSDSDSDSYSGTLMEGTMSSRNFFVEGQYTFISVSDLNCLSGSWSPRAKYSGISDFNAFLDILFTFSNSL